MTPVTVDTGAIVGGGSGNTGWSARSLFQIYDSAIEQTQNDGTLANIGNASSSTQVAQSFTPSSSVSIAQAGVYCAKIGSPTDNIVAEIRSDSSGVPSSTVLATSDSVASADISGNAYVHFTFSSPASLSASTKYWLVLKRSGSVDASNYVVVGMHSGNKYASHGVSTYNGSSWSAEHANNDVRFGLLATTQSLYQITQDSKLHVWQSTNNGSSWSELDSAGAPTVNSSTKPFSADYGLVPGSTFGYEILVVYFSAANTISVAAFNIATGLWASTAVGGSSATTDADYNRNVRVILRQIRASDLSVFYTSFADDADLAWQRRQDGSWISSGVYEALSSGSASMHADVTRDRNTNGFFTMWFYDVAANDFSVRTVDPGVAYGTKTDLDSSAADSETEHASAVYQVYDDSGSDKVVVAFIDADGTLEERVCTVGVTSASITQGTQHQVSSSTSYAGRSLATCKWGSDLYIFACTGSGIDVYRDVGADGTWLAAENWLTGLTNAVVATALPIAGVGILVSYTDNGNTVVNLYVVNATGTVSSGTLSVSGQAITGTSGAVGSLSTGTLAVSGQAVAGTVAETGAVSTGSLAVSGQGVSGVAGSVGAVGTGSHSVSGQSVSGTVADTGAVSTGAHAVSGQAIAATGGSVGNVGTGSHAVSGQAVAATGGSVGSVASGALAIAGQAISGTTGSEGDINTGSLAVSGQAISAIAGSVGSVGTGSHSVSGQAVTGTAGTQADIATGSLSVSGQTVSGVAGSVGIVGTGSHSVSGQTVEGDDGGDDASGTVDTGTLAVTGQTVTGSAGSLGSIASGSHAVTGQPITGTSGAVAVIASGDLLVNGQTVIGVTGSLASLTSGELAVIGQAVAASAGVTAEIGTGLLAVSAQLVQATSGTVAVVLTGAHVVTGQPVEGSEIAADVTGIIATGILQVVGGVILAEWTERPYTVRKRSATIYGVSKPAPAYGITKPTGTLTVTKGADDALAVAKQSATYTVEKTRS